MNEELNPCPFCGSDHVSHEISICNAKVFCQICLATFIRSNGRNDQENLNRVVSIWNTRKREQQLEEALRKAREALETCDYGYEVRNNEEYEYQKFDQDKVKNALFQIHSLLNPDPLNPKGTK